MNADVSVESLLAVLLLAAAASASAEDLFVRVNQVGYRPADVKIAIAHGARGAAGEVSSGRCGNGEGGVRRRVASD